MTEGVAISLCPVCDWKGLPERLWCPNCGHDHVGVALVHGGRLAETTTVRRAVGDTPGVRIGTVLLPEGGIVIARLEPEAQTGEQVRLFTDEGAAVARSV
jgi:uncharacterized OB-fold protein